MILRCKRAVLRQIRMPPSNEAFSYVEKNPSNKIRRDYVVSFLDYAKITFAFTARENFLFFLLSIYKQIPINGAH